MKRLSAFALAVILCLSLLPVGVLASGEAAEGSASGTCGDNLTWTLSEDGVLTISGTGEMWDNYSVDGGGPWQGVKDLIRDVVIESGVTRIGDNEFLYCDAIQSVTIPDTVTSIGNVPFDDCRALTVFYVSDDNLYFTAKDGVLFDIRMSTLIAYPAGRQEQAYEVPDSVMEIGKGAFAQCAGLRSVTLPEGLTSIGDHAFLWSGLTEITIPDSVTSIGRAAFDECRSLRSVTIGNGVTSIGVGAFQYCTALQSVTIPEGVTAIAPYTFVGCLRFTSITIPASVTSIGSCAFDRCVSLKDVYYGGTEDEWSGIGFEEGNDPLLNASIHFGVTEPTAEPSPADAPQPFGENLTWSISYDDVLTISGTGDMEDFSPSGMPWKGFQFEIEEIVIESGVTSIGENAFRDCGLLMSATIGEGVTKIGAQAFYSCSNLRTLTIPKSVTSIGEEAFYFCVSLTDVYYTGSESDWAAVTVQKDNDPLKNAQMHFNWTPGAPSDADDPALTISADGKSAQVTGDFSGLYARAALTLFNSGNGESGLYIAPCAIEADGSIEIPEFDLPGLAVTGVNVALVRSMEDITARAFKPVSMDYRYF